ncbi:MAG TPA: peptide chain release factor 2 [Patescibacteria group bacterium]|nr:peptide chain release factor 2 [Patescibacteria group bacterium]
MSLERLEALRTKIIETERLLKVDELKNKMELLAEEMNRPDFWSHQENAQTISQDYQDIKTEVEKWSEIERQVNELVELCRGVVPTPSSSTSDDHAMLTEIEKQTTELEKQFEQYEFYLLLNGPYDKNNAIVAIHAGSGGTEAQDWAEMLLRMIFRFCEKQGWKTRLLDESRGAEAGYKSVMFEVTGRYAYGYLKSEHGVHRLVRISPFDAEKMRHTSFASVEVIPEIEEAATIEIKPEDLRIDTFMSGGKGGQSVNTTYSAVRIVHIPTGITVQCQNERSQTQNKEMAMRILKSRLLKLEEEKKAKERAELRGEWKSAEWGNQIRSYVLHPYHMVNDHRTEYKATDPESVLEGNLLPLSEAYLRWIKE